MLNYSEAIQESATRLLEMERRQKKALLRDRVRLVRLLKTGECSSQREAGAHIGLSLRGSQRVWALYRKEGLEGLLRYPFKGKRRRLSEQQVLELERGLSKDQIQTLREARDFIEEQLGVAYTLGGVHYVFQCLKIKKKTGRPASVRKDEKGARTFKKNSLRW
jgi:transposase